MNMFRFFHLCLLLLALLLSGCSENSGKTPARMGVNAWLGYDPFVIAKESGFLADHCWHLVESLSSLDSSRGLRNGTLDAAAMTLEEAMALAKERVPVSVILVLSVSKGADAVLAAHPWEHYSGRGEKLKIGLEKSSLGALILKNFMDTKGLGSDRVELFYVPAEEHIAAYQSGKYDLIITYEPFVSRLKESGGHVVFDSSEMKTEVIDVLVARNEFLESNTEECVDLILAWQIGLAQLSGQLDEMVPWLSRGAGLSAEDYLSTMDGLEFMGLNDSSLWIGGKHPKLLEELQEIQEILHSSSDELTFEKSRSFLNSEPLARAREHVDAF